MDYNADTEAGDFVENPDHVTLVGLVQGLNTTSNTFFVVTPDDPTPDWSVAVSLGTGALGGYTIERDDHRSGEHHRTTAADPRAIATEIQAWAEAHA